MATTVYYNDVVDAGLQTILNWFSDSSGLVALTRLPLITEAIAGVVGSGAIAREGTLVVDAAYLNADLSFQTSAVAVIVLTTTTGTTLDGTTMITGFSTPITINGPVTCINSPTISANSGIITINLQGADASTCDLTTATVSGADANNRVIFQNYTGVLDWTNATTYGPYITTGDISFGATTDCQINNAGCVAGSVTNNSAENGIPYSGQDSNNPGVVNGTFTDISNGTLGTTIINGPSFITNTNGYESNGNTYNGGLRFTTTHSGAVPAQDENTDIYNSWIIVDFLDSAVVYFTKGAPGSSNPSERNRLGE